MDLSLTPTEVAYVVKACLEQDNGDGDVPIILIEGAPGIGKTDCIGQVADALKRTLVSHLRLSQIDAPDIRGVPDVVHMNGKLKWVPPDWFPLDENSTDIILLDELGQGLHTTQAASMQFVLERCVGENKLPRGCGIVAATNRLSDRSGVHRLLAALSRRFTHITMVPDVPSWCKWAVGPYGQARGMDPAIIAFIRFRPHLLHEFDPQRDVDPNPRAWQKVSRIKNMDVGPPDLKPAHKAKLKHAMIAGTVGEGAATECTAFLKVFSRLPSLDAILLNPKTAKLPDGLDVKCAVATGLAMAATPTNMGAVVQYADRLGEELSQFCIGMAAQHDPAVQSTHAFTQWAIKHQDTEWQ